MPIQHATPKNIALCLLTPTFKLTSWWAVSPLSLSSRSWKFCSRHLLYYQSSLASDAGSAVSCLRRMTAPVSTLPLWWVHRTTGLSCFADPGTRLTLSTTCRYFCTKEQGESRLGIQFSPNATVSFCSLNRKTRVKTGVVREHTIQGSYSVLIFILILATTE